MKAAFRALLIFGCFSLSSCSDEGSASLPLEVKLTRRFDLNTLSMTALENDVVITNIVANEGGCRIDGKNLDPVIFPSQTLKMGNVATVWIRYCNVIKVYIETNRGGATYDFSDSL